MAERLTPIVRAATAGDAGLEWVSALTCDRRPGRRPCPGQLAVLRTDVPLSITWRCTSPCGDEGVISGWERSLYDLRPRQPRLRATDVRRVVIPADTAAALRGLQLLDSDTERFVFRAEASEEGVFLVGDDDDLDELIGYVAAESNHEGNRRRHDGSTTRSSSSAAPSTGHDARESKRFRTAMAAPATPQVFPAPRSPA